MACSDRWNCFAHVVLILLCTGSVTLRADETSRETAKPRDAKPVEGRNVEGETGVESSGDEEERKLRRERMLRSASRGLGSTTNLIALPQIQSELMLTAQQARKIQRLVQDISRDTQTLFRGVRNLPPEEQQIRVQELQRQSEVIQIAKQKEIQEVLTPEQKLRLVGISMRMRGPASLLDPEVGDLLQLTDEQREQMIELALTFETRMSALRRPGPSGTTVDIAGALRALREELEQKYLEILTDEQKSRFESSQGEPLEALAVPAQVVPE